MDSLLRQLLDLPPPLVYLVCGLLVTLETAVLPGIVLPPLSALLLMGGLTENGALDLPLALAVTVLAAVLGDQLAYLDGKRWGPRLRSRLGDARWAKAEGFVARYGVPGVIAGRCLAGVRTVVPRVAGSVAMPHRWFTAGSACAAVLWAGAGLLAGHAGSSALS